MRDLNFKIENVSGWRYRMFRREHKMQNKSEQMRDKLYMSHIINYPNKEDLRSMLQTSLEPRQEIVIPELFKLKIE